MLRQPCLTAVGYVILLEIFSLPFGFAGTLGDRLFSTQSHDFGRVFVGADAEYRFEAVNNSDHDVQLMSVRSSCGCTAGKLSTNVLKPGESGAVIARLNTSGSFSYQKSATLTVQLRTNVNGRTQDDKVQLSVRGYIRRDVLLTPRKAEFGSVKRGESRSRTVQLDYTGKTNNWGITKIESPQPYISAKAEEIKRNQRGISYKISIVLTEDAPSGYIQETLRITTNEIQQDSGEPAEVLLPVQGVISAPIQTKPSPTLLLGLLAPEETVTKNIVIRSGTSFRVTDVKTQDQRFKFAYSDQRSTMQMVSILFAAPPKNEGVIPQTICTSIRIATDDVSQQMIPIDVLVRTTDE